MGGRGREPFSKRCLPRKTFLQQPLFFVPFYGKISSLKKKKIFFGFFLQQKKFFSAEIFPTENISLFYTSFPCVKMFHYGKRKICFCRNFLCKLYQYESEKTCFSAYFSSRSLVHNALWYHEWVFSRKCCAICGIFAEADKHESCNKERKNAQ